MDAQRILEQVLRQGSSALGGMRGGGFGGGAAVGGVLGLLLGTRGGRRLGGGALKYGSVAALGALAYHAYQQWQAKQAQGGGPVSATGTTVTPQPPAGLPPPADEATSRAVLTAMIAAAKSDGHLDERERGVVEAELAKTGVDARTRQWFEAELRRPLDPAEVARAATSPEVAAEMYLASLLVVDETSFMERAYLDELARQLKLPEGLKAELEKQAGAAAA